MSNNAKKAAAKKIANTSNKTVKKEVDRKAKVDNTVAEIKRLSKIYDRNYFENGIATKKSNYVDYSWERLGYYFQKTAQHIVDTFKPKKSLDVGCAKGYLVKGLVEFGIDAYGIDPSVYALAEAHPDIKDRLAKGIAQSLPFPDNSFDVVTCFDVMEHIPSKDISKALMEMLRVSKQWLILRLVTKKLGDDLDIYHENIQNKGWWCN